MPWPSVLPQRSSHDYELTVNELFELPTESVARRLLGWELVHRSTTDSEWVGGLIVETEAYLAQRDTASHSARGRTSSNGSMFLPSGHLYVYPIHAKHCLNVVTESEGSGSAVLIRAIEPTRSLNLMVEHRGTDDPRRLTSGPGMICQAMNVDRQHDGIDLRANDCWRLKPAVRVQKSRITSTSRIGISSAKHRKLRFFVDGNGYVSGRASDHQRPRRDALQLA